MEGGDAPALIEAIEAATQPDDLPVACIVVDTTSQTMGGETRTTKGMANFIVSAKTIENHFECVTIPIHHVARPTP